jgi:drug/metabolite transporter (DMT)-like permease
MFQAYPRIGTRRTIVLIQCLAPPFAALGEWAWLGHAPTWLQAGFGILILAGVGIALMPGRAEAQPTHGLVAGTCFGVVSALCQGGGAVFSRKAYQVANDAGQALHGVRDGMSVALQRVLGGILVSGVFLLYLKFAHKPFATRKADWTAARPWLIASGLTGPALGVTCYQWALMTEQTNVVLPIVAVTPLAVIPLAHWLEGDRITQRAVVGGIVAVAGVIGLTLSSAH